jgi:hypothetical protein
MMLTSAASFRRSGIDEISLHLTALRSNRPQMLRSDVGDAVGVNRGERTPNAGTDVEVDHSVFAPAAPLGRHKIPRPRLARMDLPVVYDPHGTEYIEPLPRVAGTEPCRERRRLVGSFDRQLATISSARTG